MVQLYIMKGWNKWPLIRAHLCTLAVSASFNSTWRAPQEAFRYGGVQFALATTVASLVTLPLALLQLALGQLSQQDAVGIYRAVPFFQGVGYLRLLVSALGCAYSAVYVALTVAYFLYTLGHSIPFLSHSLKRRLLVSALGCAYSAVYVALTVAYFLYTLGHSIPFRACSDPRLNEDGFEDILNSTNCLNATFLAPVRQKPEYYIATSLIILFIWITFPFLLYNPVKLMKRIFYVLGPTLVVVGIVVASCIGSWSNLSALHSAAGWRHFLQPHVWLGAVAQALLSAQVAGGYLVSAGDAIYSTTNVQWTAVAFVATNVVTVWCGLLFWFAVGGSVDLDTSSAAVLELMYRVAYERDLSVAWPLIVFAALFLSGVITMLTFLYPVFERVRRSGGVRWRAACAGGSALGAAASLAVLAGRWDALALLEDTAVPLLASVATVLEVLAFVFIYGWKVLMEDVEFLTGQDLSKFWMMGWCAAPGVIFPFILWWIVVVIMTGGWSVPPWGPSGVAATGAVAVLIILVFAAVAVARQVQYDTFGKLKSSFKPSRHWGPRDPIAHYYWLARRDERATGARPRARRYRRRELGQLSGAPSFLNIADTGPANRDINSNEVKRRSNSDDWIYTVYRRKYLEEAFSEYLAKSKKLRSLSLDWAQIPRVRQKKNSMELKILNSSDYVFAADSVESVKEVSSKVVFSKNVR